MPSKRTGTAKAAPKRRRRRVNPEAVSADALRLCREGKHPPGRRIGRGCGLCGKADAWR